MHRQSQYQPYVAEDRNKVGVRGYARRGMHCDGSLFECVPGSQVPYSIAKRV